MREYEIKFQKKVVTDYEVTYRVFAYDKEEAADLASEPEATMHSSYIKDRQTYYPSYSVEEV